LISLFLTSYLHASAKEKILEKSSDLFDSLTQGVTIAILPLQNKIPLDTTSGVTVSEILINIANAKSVRVVERVQLSEVLSEQALIASGAVSESNMSEIGELLSAQYLLVGSVSKLMGEKLISLKLVKTATGEIVNSKNFSIGTTAFQEMQSELYGEATQTSATVFRSALIPGWGQTYANKATRGIIWGTLFATSIGTGIYGQIGRNNAWTQYKHLSNPNTTLDLKKEYCSINGCTTTKEEGKPDINQTEIFNDYSIWSEKKKQDAYEDYESKLMLSNIFWGVAGAVWVANLVDAYIVGSEKTKKMNTYFSALPTQDGGVTIQLGMNF
jgi:TolB-like protein